MKKDNDKNTATDTTKADAAYATTMLNDLYNGWPASAANPAFAPYTFPTPPQSAPGK
jgi:hypothetical protein